MKLLVQIIAFPLGLLMSFCGGGDVHAGGESAARSSDVSSENHPVLARCLEDHPEVDGDGNGTLTLHEFNAWVESKQPKRRQRRKRRNKGSHRVIDTISPLLSNGDILIADFDSRNFARIRQQGWTVEGEAFRHGPERTTKIMRGRVGPYSGKYFLSSYAEGESGIGRAISPEFTIDLNYIEFLLSGGDSPGRLSVNLRLDDEVVRTITGRNDDLFESVAFDVGSLRGRNARMEIIDADRGVWGHLNVDRIVQTMATDARRVITEAPRGHEHARAVVHTRAGRSAGALTVRAGHLQVGAQPLALEDVLLIVTDGAEVSARKSRRGRPPGRAGSRSWSVLRLRNGEVWFAEIRGLEKRKLTVRSPLFGDRVVPLVRVASIDFQADVETSEEPNTLYRSGGEPIPGKLVWIREKDIAIDCPLGIVPVPRDSVTRFVIKPPRSAARRFLSSKARDEVQLSDGTLLRGLLALPPADASGGQQEFVLKHPTLGDLRLKFASIRHVRRVPAGTTWLADVGASKLDRHGPFAPPPAPAPVFVESRPDSKAALGCLQAVRVLPRTSAHYRLRPAPKEGLQRTFRAVLTPVAGAKTDVSVRVLVENSEIWQQRVHARSGPVDVDVELPPSAQDVTLAVDFCDGLGFPCGVEWWEAHVLMGSKEATGSTGSTEATGSMEK